MCVYYCCGWRGYSFILLIEESNGGLNVNEFNFIFGLVVYIIVEILFFFLNC